MIKHRRLVPILPSLIAAIAARPIAAKRSPPEPLKKITIVLVDDSALIRKALCALLESEPDCEVIGQACNGHDGVKAAGTYAPDVIVMDISMPDLNGLDATRLIITKNSKAKVLLISALDGTDSIESFVAVGARGFVLKMDASTTLAGAIRKVDKGETFFPNAV